MAINFPLALTGGYDHGKNKGAQQQVYKNKVPKMQEWADNIWQSQLKGWLFDLREDTGRANRRKIKG